MFTPLECRLRAAECQKMAEYAPNPHVRTALATGPKARKAIKFSDSLVEVPTFTRAAARKSNALT
jgi:hypothetical protein